MIRKEYRGNDLGHSKNVKYWVTRSQASIMGIIYLIKNLLNNKTYVGQTKCDLNKRWNGHKSSYERYIRDKNHGCSWALYGAIKKYGFDNFALINFKQIEDKYLDEYETKYIKILNTMVPNGYNIRTGGSTGKHCLESREKMRKSKLGDKNHNYGKPRSESFKKLISEKKSGENHHFFNKKLSEEHKQKLSISHKNNKNDMLPMYISYINERPAPHYSGEGYVVTIPGFKKHFTSKKLSIEQKLKMASDYASSIKHK